LNFESGHNETLANRPVTNNSNISPRNTENDRLWKIRPFSKKMKKTWDPTCSVSK